MDMNKFEIAELQAAESLLRHANDYKDVSDQIAQSILKDIARRMAAIYAQPDDLDAATQALMSYLNFGGESNETCE
jgi:hypothetical protein